jgi:hypothetical protein
VRGLQATTLKTLLPEVKERYRDVMPFTSTPYWDGV